jgi:hypothetical protein
MPAISLNKGAFLALAMLFCLTFVGESRAQSVVQSSNEVSTTTQQTSRPEVVVPSNDQIPPVASRSTLLCAGFIKFQRIPESPEIVGGEQEQEQSVFTDGDIVYLNAGSQQGIKDGDRFQVIRPRGEVKGVHRQKRGPLGIYVQEVGMLQVFQVRENTSAAQITFTCGSVLLGDLLRRIPHKESPLQRPAVALDRFADPSNKQTGRLMMSRDGREMVATNDVVYIDLGSEDKVAPGDYLTIYRPLGTGKVTRVDNEENARGRAAGFQSDRFRGGGYSIMAKRAKDSTAFGDADGSYRYRPITTKQIKRDRPLMPRKIVGEMVILDVQLRTATAIITRVASEVHTGDWVEIQ